MSDEFRPQADGPEIDGPANDPLEADEATEASASDTLEQASEGSSIKAESEDETAEIAAPPAKLERLQKILAQAGVASRRHAEELIEQGRVQVNGTVVTALGTKADASRDHIRVDGKLLQGAERLRYFVLNKPRGFVTTVSDPEGRPTVMQFFDKMRERLYPVGRLDYLSEGLLVVTNDGDLANKLTKAASGVEKTYLVKVSGQPTEEELERLREGVAIDRGKPGSGQVHTSPARIRQVRQGDNPWYEVVLIEGRNRELRKMFEEIGHFVEKIRRVGYGPLVLDQEPGNMRELESDELEQLRLAADGKLRKPRGKESRRRSVADAPLPTVAPRAGRMQRGERRDARPDRGGSGEFRPKNRFGEVRPSRPAPGGREGYRPAASRDSESRPRYSKPEFGQGRPSQARPAWKRDDRKPSFPAQEDRPGADRGRQGSAGRGRTGGGRPFGAKPAWNKSGGGDRPEYQRPAAPRRDAPQDAPFAGGPPAPKPPRLQIDAIEPDRPATQRPFTDRSGASRSGAGRPPYRASGAGRPSGGRPASAQSRPDRPRAEKPRFDRSASDRPQFDRPKFDRARTDRPSPGRPGADRPKFERPKFDRPRSDRPSSGGGPRGGTSPRNQERPRRAEGGLARPFTTSTGKPRAGGARPSSKPSSRGGRAYGDGGASRAGSRPAPGGSAPRRGEGTGWKPKPSFGGGKSAAGGRSKPEFRAKSGTGFSRPGSSSRKPGGKSGGKSAFGRPGGSRPGGSKPGGKRPGKGPGHRSRG